MIDIIIFLLVFSAPFVYMLFMLWCEIKWRFYVHYFSPGLFFNEYDINGKKFQSENLIRRYFIIERRGSYVLVQNLDYPDREPYECNIRTMTTYSDKWEIVDDSGRVVITVKNK